MTRGIARLVGRSSHIARIRAAVAGFKGSQFTVADLRERLAGVPTNTVSSSLSDLVTQGCVRVVGRQGPGATSKRIFEEVSP